MFVFTGIIPIVQNEGKLRQQCDLMEILNEKPIDFYL